MVITNDTRQAESLVDSIKQGTKRLCFNHWIRRTQPQLLKPWKRSSRYYTETFHSETGWSSPNSPKKLDSDVYLVMTKIIRKEFGLYNQNATRINSCRNYLGTDYDSYEDSAMVIIKELWKKVCRVHHLRLVKS